MSMTKQRKIYKYKIKTNKIKIKWKVYSVHIYVCIYSILYVYILYILYSCIAEGKTRFITWHETWWSYNKEFIDTKTKKLR